MSRRECPNCGASSLLSEAGVKEVYQGTPSWSDLKGTVQRLENNPHCDRICSNCEALV